MNYDILRLCYVARDTTNAQSWTRRFQIETALERGGPVQDGFVAVNLTPLREPDSR